MRHHNLLRGIVAGAIITIAGPALAGPNDDLAAEVSERATAAGVPVDPLLRKIREGEAKGVPPQRIRPAVMALHDRLVRGRDLCGDAAPIVCVEAAADALASGLVQARLEGLVAGPDAAAGELQRTRIFVAAATLRAQGASPDATIEQVSVALTRGELDALLPRTDADGVWSPPAKGRGGELPVQNPTRDRDSTGRGKAWGRDKARGKPAKPGRPDDPGKSGDAPGQQ